MNKILYILQDFMHIFIISISMWYYIINNI